MEYYESAKHANARQQELNRIAEMHQLASIAAGDKKSPIYGPALSKAGDILVGLGQQLQQRYGEAVESPLPRIETAH